jgi:hypothetical protein
MTSRFCIIDDQKIVSGTEGIVCEIMTMVASDVIRSSGMNGRIIVEDGVVSALKPKQSESLGSGCKQTIKRLDVRWNVGVKPHVVL